MAGGLCARERTPRLLARSIGAALAGALVICGSLATAATPAVEKLGQEPDAGWPTVAGVRAQARTRIRVGHWSSTIVRDGIAFERVVVRTRWLTAEDDLRAVVAAAIEDLGRPGDTVVISEKVALLLSQMTIPTACVHPGVLARLLARGVRPRPGSRGLSVPEKMQFVLDRTGRPRVLLAALLGALSRPLGMHGVFYRVAGRLARDLDGARPPFAHLLFPPFDRADAAAVCARLEGALGTGVAIVDINDFGGSIRATSNRALPARVLCDVLRDNPLGQQVQRTPIGIVRCLPATES